MQATCAVHQSVLFSLTFGSVLHDNLVHGIHLPSRYYNISAGDGARHAMTG